MNPSTEAECTCRQEAQSEDGRTVLPHRLPVALTHLYPLPPLGAEAIPVYQGPFASGGKDYEGIIKLGLRPLPRLWAQGQRTSGISLADVKTLFDSVGQAGWVDRPEVVIPSTSTVPTPPTTAAFTEDRSPGSSWTPPFMPIPFTMNSGATVDEVTFYVLNGWRADDGLATCHNGVIRHGRLRTTLGNDWELRLEPRGDHAPKDVLNYMHTHGAHTVTHVGRLRRPDLVSFTADETLPVLDVIDDLLSFAMGRSISTTLPVGWTAHQPVWTYWSGMRGLDLPVKTTSWLDQSDAAQQITELLQHGYQASQDPLRWGVFKNALSYYLTANTDASTPMSTLLPVSGLQVLDYGHFVETLPKTDPHHISSTDWKALNAQTILRDLMTLTGADLSIPDSFPHLTATHTAATRDAAANKKTAPPDPLGSLVKMRNSIAHPTHTTLGKWIYCDWVEAGIYTLHLFDVAMLWWLGYNGTYHPRTGSSPGPVPWAPTHSTTTP